jgi:putative transposase
VPAESRRRLQRPTHFLARIGRFVVPDLPHHVTQRGNRREKVSFSDDNALSRDLLHEACRREGVVV